MNRNFDTKTKRFEMNIWLSTNATLKLKAEMRNSLLWMQQLRWQTINHMKFSHAFHDWHSFSWRGYAVSDSVRQKAWKARKNGGEWIVFVYAKSGSSDKEDKLFYFIVLIRSIGTNSRHA